MISALLLFAAILILVFVNTAIDAIKEVTAAIKDQHTTLIAIGETFTKMIYAKASENDSKRG